MTMEVAALLEDVGSGFGRAGQTLLQAGRLCEGSLVSADLAYSSSSRRAMAHLRLADSARAAQARQRLAFWFARAGGRVQDLEAMAPEARETLTGAFDTYERTLRDATAESWCAQAADLLGLPPGAAILQAHPVLELHPGGPANAGLLYDPAAGVLFIQSPLAPAAGDELKLLLREGSRSAAAIVTVTSVRRPCPGQRIPAGFSLLIRPDDADVRRVLSESLPPAARGVDARAAPRFRVRGTVAVETARGGDEVVEYRDSAEFQRDYLENLSHGGAFIRTSTPRERGDRIAVRLRVPGGPELRIPGMVVHVGERGIGVEFSNDSEALELLAAVIAELSGRAPRVLVVDDDALARTMLAEALCARGFEVRTVADGEDGLRAITDELFSLDAVITDVNMPGMTGDALVSTVRQLGGETDLALVAMSATIDEERARSLLGFGADAVVLKASGVGAIVDSVDAAVTRRKNPGAERRGAPTVVADPFAGAAGTADPFTVAR